VHSRDVALAFIQGHIVIMMTGAPRMGEIGNQYLSSENSCCWWNTTRNELLTPNFTNLVKIQTGLPLSTDQRDWRKHSPVRLLSPGLEV
jgi:hypothetical protein